MEVVGARCLMCGKTYQVQEDHKDYRNLVAQEKEMPTFICDICNHRVRYESDEQRREKKPL
ncbi:DUF2197 domain-containing protein [Syntrophomonas erecta]